MKSEVFFSYTNCFSSYWTTVPSPRIVLVPVVHVIYADDIVLCSTRRDEVENKLEEWRRAMRRQDREGAGDQ